MGAKIDYTNQKYNRLVGITPTEKRKSGSIIWKWRCDCGNEAFYTGSDVKSGHVKSCGCLNLELSKRRASQMGAARRIDYTDKTFYKLTGTQYLYTTNGGNAIWLWQCECGNTHEADANNVKRGLVKSCGCLKSLSEQLIKQLLKENNVIFKSQYTFAGELMGNNNKCLCFDFAVLNNQGLLQYLIEYDGQQHFKSIEYWDGSSGLAKRHQYDLAKNNWCYTHNIPLIRIPYTHSNIIIDDLILETTKFLCTPNNEKQYYNKMELNNG